MDPAMEGILMTINHVRMAFEETMPVNQKFVFVVLCDMADNSNACWPGSWLISKRTSLPEEIVLHEIGKLKDAGLIEISKNQSYMGKIRSTLIIVYPDKSIKNQEKQKTSYLSKDATHHLQEHVVHRKSTTNPTLASDIARAKIAAIKKNLANTQGGHNEQY